MKRLENITVIDLFCGIGGLSYGLYNEGFDIVAGIDTDESCRYCYERNNKAKLFVKTSIRSQEKKSIGYLAVE